MKKLLEGKVAVITGAASGVGRATATLFVEHGAKVVCADIDGGGASDTADHLRTLGGAAASLPCDVALAEAMDAAVALAVENFGGLDIIHNNAGVGTPPSPVAGRVITLLDMTEEQLERMNAINVQGVINGCRAATRVFEAQGRGGAIINTASAAGLIGWGGVAYNANKGAVVQITRALALELAPQGIRVNSICPGAMKTNFGSMAKMSAEAEDFTRRLHPLGRLIDPIDCAHAVAFLASDHAVNITGVNLPVDGGMTAGVFLGGRK